MVGITQTSDGRQWRVGDGRCIEPVGRSCCTVKTLSRGGLIFPMHLTSVSSSARYALSAVPTSEAMPT